MAKTAWVKSKGFYDEYFRNPNPDKKSTHYCPGCGHGNVHKFIAEALEDFGVIDNAIVVSPVGCSVFAYYYFDTGNIQAAHGRAPAVATGIKRTHPHSIVISYQGDGDLAAIGTAETIHAANRGENITVIFINNAIYGMTGGQMAPTTLLGQTTTTSPRGRSNENEGFPIKVCEMLNSLEAPVYIERVSLHDLKHRAKARMAVRKAIQNQVEGKGFSFVEVLSPCPSGWKMDPVDAMKWIEQEMTKVFPIGVLRDRSKEIEPKKPEQNYAGPDEIKEILGLSQLKDTNLPKANPEPKYKNPEIKAAGFGGQGILLLGLGMAQTGMLEGYNVSWIPSYGPEMRGGTANCHVRISEEPVGSPLVTNPTVLVAMNRPSLEKFEKDVKEGGLIIYDSSLIDVEPTRKDVEIMPLPATKMADELGNTRVANMVVLGAYVGYTNALNLESVYETLNYIISRKRLININKEAVKKGYDFGMSLREKA
ncbi:MAG: 2-oxoacid:acceptor oxidoreductase family protein [Calditrichia bacterium]